MAAATSEGVPTAHQQRASFATLIAVSTLAALIGGAVPVPSGAGVVEAGLIAGLTAAGIPEDQPSRRCSSSGSSPPTWPTVWGWATLAWMRRGEYV